MTHHKENERIEGDTRSYAALGVGALLLALTEQAWNRYLEHQRRREKANDRRYTLNSKFYHLAVKQARGLVADVVGNLPIDDRDQLHDLLHKAENWDKVDAINARHDRQREALRVLLGKHKGKNRFSPLHVSFARLVQLARRDPDNVATLLARLCDELEPQSETFDHDRAPQPAARGVVDDDPEPANCTRAPHIPRSMCKCDKCKAWLAWEARQLQRQAADQRTTPPQRDELPPCSRCTLPAK